eukprot:scaffold706_cov418-Prasinococcus_capsulatus_cf.AAC.20
MRVRPRIPVLAPAGSPVSRATRCYSSSVPVAQVHAPTAHGRGLGQLGGHRRSPRRRTGFVAWAPERHHRPAPGIGRLDASRHPSRCPIAQGLLGPGATPRCSAAGNHPPFKFP